MCTLLKELRQEKGESLKAIPLPSILWVFKRKRGCGCFFLNNHTLFSSRVFTIATSYFL